MSTTPAGILVIDKPLGPTSMNICANIRWRLKQGGAPKRIKVGHGGTLDPLATGVLVILVGSCTRLCDQIMVGQKEYQTTIDLSAISTTDDDEGEKTLVTLSANIPPTLEAVHIAASRFTGEIMQTPPAYSAVHIGGRRAYDLARSGETELLAEGLRPRPARIDAIRILSYKWPILTIAVTCGKGVYIRSLARDIGVSMGVGGYLTALRRTRVGKFDLSMAKRPNDLPETLTQAELLPPP